MWVHVGGIGLEMCHAACLVVLPNFYLPGGEALREPDSEGTPSRIFFSSLLVPPSTTSPSRCARVCVGLRACARARFPRMCGVDRDCHVGLNRLWWALSVWP